MRIELGIAGIVLCVGLAALSGCNKEEPAADTQAPRTTEGLASEAAKAVDVAKTAAKDATDQAATQLKAAEQQAQTLIDRAKSLVADKKYRDALTSLSQLTNVRLTAEQQKLVDDLKAQIQSALAKATAADPAAALGGALGGKK